MVFVTGGGRSCVERLRESRGREARLYETSERQPSPPRISPMITYYQVLEAYYRARRSGRTKSSIDLWEYDYERRCYDIFLELQGGSYKSDIRYAFISRDPVWREIIVPSFHDRVVHHLISSYLEPILERRYIYDTYAGRRGKGLLFAIRRVEGFARSITRSYERDTHVMRLDIASFFRSISHERIISWLEHSIFPRLDNSIIENLMLMHITQSRSRIFRDRSEWGDFPPSKSIFTAPHGYGLPLGDLVSQHLANGFLSQIDYFVKHTLGVRYYGRYMDDMILFAHSREELISWRSQISHFLEDRLELSLHPDKTIIRDFALGVDCLGRRILPYRTYIGPRLKESFIRRAIYADESHEGLVSVLGMIGHHDTERLSDKYVW